MKKIIAIVIGALIVVGAGVALWLVLDSSVAAASVGKTKITENQIKTSVNQVIAERKTVSTTGMQLAFGSALNAEEVNFYILSKLLVDTAAANNITLSEADVTAREAAILKQEGSAAKLKSGMVSASIASGDFPGYVREILYVDALTKLVEKNGTSVANSGTAVQSLVRQQALKEGVKVSAKYGTWDPTQVTVTPPTK
ncbi:MAG TPA: hypothetical protein VIH79_01160 [Candidatus Nanopelagicaceae bacterium]